MEIIVIELGLDEAGCVKGSFLSVLVWRSCQLRSWFQCRLDAIL